MRPDLHAKIDMGGPAWLNETGLGLAGARTEGAEESSALIYAPNFCKRLACASANPIKFIIGCRPNPPRVQLRSSKRVTVSGRTVLAARMTGTGCQLCPASAAGVEWSPVTTRTSGLSDV